MTHPESEWLHSWIGSSDRDRITVAVRAGDIMLAAGEPQGISARNALRGHLLSIALHGPRDQVRDRLLQLALAVHEAPPVPSATHASRKRWTSGAGSPAFPSNSAP